MTRPRAMDRALAARARQSPFGSIVPLDGIGAAHHTCQMSMCTVHTQLLLLCFCDVLSLCWFLSLFVGSVYPPPPQKAKTTPSRLRTTCVRIRTVMTALQECLGASDGNITVPIHLWDTASHLFGAIWCVHAHARACTHVHMYACTHTRAPVR